MKVLRIETKDGGFALIPVANTFVSYNKTTGYATFSNGGTEDSFKLDPEELMDKYEMLTPKENYNMQTIEEI